MKRKKRVVVNKQILIRAGCCDIDSDCSDCKACKSVHTIGSHFIVCSEKYY